MLGFCMQVSSTLPPGFDIEMNIATYMSFPLHKPNATIALIGLPIMTQDILCR